MPIYAEDIDVPLPPMQHSVKKLTWLGADASDLSERAWLVAQNSDPSIGFDRLWNNQCLSPLTPTSMRNCGNADVWSVMLLSCMKTSWTFASLAWVSQSVPLACHERIFCDHACKSEGPGCEASPRRTPRRPCKRFPWWHWHHHFLWLWPFFLRQVCQIFFLFSREGGLLTWWTGMT